MTNPVLPLCGPGLIKANYSTCVTKCPQGTSSSPQAKSIFDCVKDCIVCKAVTNGKISLLKPAPAQNSPAAWFPSSTHPCPYTGDDSTSS